MSGEFYLDFIAKFAENFMTEVPCGKKYISVMGNVFRSLTFIG